MIRGTKKPVDRALDACVKDTFYFRWQGIFDGDGRLPHEIIAVKTGRRLLQRRILSKAAFAGAAMVAVLPRAGRAADARLVSQFQIGQIAETRAAKPPARKGLPKSHSPQRAAGDKVGLLTRQDGAPRLVMVGAQENWDEF
jgi:hypothetical protein